MTACKLVINIDDPRPRTGGEPITGTIVVRPEKQVTCKGLVARCTWSTHGRGNIDSGEVDSQTLYEGTWQAGQEYSYPFKLNTAVWPPTYYGSFLNVSHYVTAQAKLSWASDPKTQVEFPVVAATAPEDLKPTVNPKSQKAGGIGMVIGVVIVGILLALFGTLFLILLPIIGVVAGLVWFFKVFLPKRITGPVVCELKSNKASGGSLVEAAMQFTPQRNSTINGVEWTISCVEVCTSGSGSNRQTHRHEVLKETRRVAETLQLKAGQKQSFDLSYQLPASVPPSLKFGNNEVSWNIEGRIDIPGWPDFIKKLPLIVCPTAGSVAALNMAGADASYEGAVPGLPPVTSSAIGAATAKAPGDEAWFQEVVQQIQQSQHDHEQMALVISAVRQFEFPIAATIEDEIDTPEFEDDVEFERLDDWEWWTAYVPAQNVSLALAWFESPSTIRPGANWSGFASIVGYDIDAKRVLMEVTR